MLGWCAYQMGQRTAGLSRDLGWWDIPNWLPRRQVRRWLLGGLALGLPAAGLLLLYGLVMGWVGLVGGLVGWLVAGLAAGLGFGLIGAALRDLFADPRGLWGRVRAPRSMVIRWPTQRELRNLPLILIALGLVFWFGQGAKFASCLRRGPVFMSPAFGLYLRCGTCLLELPQMSLLRNPPIVGRFGPDSSEGS